MTENLRYEVVADVRGEWWVWDRVTDALVSGPWVDKVQAEISANSWNRRYWA